MRLVSFALCLCQKGKLLYLPVGYFVSVGDGLDIIGSLCIDALVERVQVGMHRGAEGIDGGGSHQRPQDGLRYNHSIK